MPQPRYALEREIGKHRSRTQSIRRRSSRHDRGQRADGLGGDQHEGDVESGQRLQEQHAEADALEGIEDAEPEPEAAAEEGAGGVAAAQDPGDVQADVGGGPEHLAPARGAEADGEDGDDPAVEFGEGA